MPFGHSETLVSSGSSVVFWIKTNWPDGSANKSCTRVSFVRLLASWTDRQTDEQLARGARVARRPQARASRESMRAPPPPPLGRAKPAQLARDFVGDVAELDRPPAREALGGSAAVVVVVVVVIIETRA